jgi:carbamoyl-phosphate synthase/aspartate carbamoyltransferase
LDLCLNSRTLPDGLSFLFFRMVGYTESITDPSYEGQILVFTFPLVGSYGVPARDSAFNSSALPAYFESNKIHVAGLVVGSYSGEGNDYSHHLASSELAQWLKEENIPAVYGVDTRALTKKIREKGVLLGKLLAQKQGVDGGKPAPASIADWRSLYVDLPFHDPNVENLVARVSSGKPRLYTPDSFATSLSQPRTLIHPSGRPLRILAIDVGMKYNQIRCFVLRGVELKTVPWDYDFLSPNEEPFDGLFISNGPGDPSLVVETVQRLRAALESRKFPIFGICLGHQLLAIASGAKTMKLKYGNRGHNIPCTDLISGRCYITSQNHGYAVDTDTLQEGWKELFVNANDGSNEGIMSTTQPAFSVQFHPESTPGPRDTEFLFDVFIANVMACAREGKLVPINMPGGTLEENVKAYPRVNVKKVLVLGSGGLSIGQAGEFDYSGSQAIKALKEEGIYTGTFFFVCPRRVSQDARNADLMFIYSPHQPCLCLPLMMTWGLRS